MSDADISDRIKNQLHFRTENQTALCRAFSMNRLRMTPERERVTCPKCRALLAERRATDPTAEGAGHVR